MRHVISSREVPTYWASNSCVNGCMSTLPSVWEVPNRSEKRTSVRARRWSIESADRLWMRSVNRGPADQMPEAMLSPGWAVS